MIESGCRTGPNDKAVNKRAQLLPGEYRKKAKDGQFYAITTFYFSGAPP